MVIKNIEILFNIKIKKCNFIYILFFEHKDKSLMEYCNKIENKLDYIFYSIEKNDFVNENGKKIRIKNYIKDLKNMKNYLNFFPKNENRDENELNYFISVIPEHLDIDQNKKLFLSQKRNRSNYEENKNEDVNNFIEFYDIHNSLIIKDKNKKNIRTKFFEKYKNILPKKNSKKNEVLQNNSGNEEEEDIDEKYDLKYVDEEENTDIKKKNSKNNENKGNIQNYEIEKDYNKDKEMRKQEGKSLIDKHFKSIVKINDDIYYGYEFTEEYNKKMKNILKNIDTFKEDIENIYSCLSCTSNINILSNLLFLPFYYLICNKINKKIYILFQYEEKIHIYEYNEELKELDEPSTLSFINILIKEKNIKENYITLFCSLAKKRIRE